MWYGKGYNDGPDEDCSDDRYCRSCGIVLVAKNSSELVCPQCGGLT